MPLSVSDLVGHGLDQGFEETGSYAAIGLLVQLGVSELGRPVDRHEQVELAFLSSHLGNVDVDIADGIGLELLLSSLVALGLRQTADPIKQRCRDDRVRCGSVACRA